MFEKIKKAHDMFFNGTKILLDESDTIAVSSFVKGRHTPEEPHSHFDGTWDELLDVVNNAKKNESNIIPGYRDGVLLVIVPAKRFLTSIVPNESVERFNVEYTPRKKGEKPVLKISSFGDKTPAVYVEIVLYSHETLTESSEASCDADWEVISINASPINEAIPMNNTTRARNVLCEPGGTDPHLEQKTKEELIEFIRDTSQATMFWSRHTMVQPPIGTRKDVTN